MYRYKINKTKPIVINIIGLFRDETYSQYPIVKIPDYKACHKHSLYHHN